MGIERARRKVEAEQRRHRAKPISDGHDFTHEQLSVAYDSGLGFALAVLDKERAGAKLNPAPALEVEDGPQQSMAECSNFDEVDPFTKGVLWQKVAAIDRYLQEVESRRSKEKGEVT